jgi:hypothetical protein
VQVALGGAQVRGFTRTGGVLTPLHGAVVKIALRITLLFAIVAGLTPWVFCPVAHSRTCTGMMSIISIVPKSRMRCLYSA